MAWVETVEELRAELNELCNNCTVIMNSSLPCKILIKYTLAVNCILVCIDGL